MKKDDLFEIKVEDMDVDGNGIGHTEDGMAVFVHGGIPGERILAKAIKVKKNYAVAVISRIIETPGTRREPPCGMYKHCGGCTVMHMDYAAQLDMKHRRVINCMERIGGISTPVAYPLPSVHEFRYRNKAAFPVSMSAGVLKAGFYRKRSHELCDVPDCLLQKDRVSLLMGQVRSWIVHENIPVYDEVSHRGLLRHIVIRSVSNGDMMMTLVINGEGIPGIKKLLHRVEYVFPELKSIVLSHNTEKGNVILGSSETVVYGPGFITEYLDDLVFRVSAHSFMQVNFEGMKMLYSTLFKMLKLNGTETVADLYCGVGTISLMAARQSHMVYGIEIIEDAVKSAEVNAALNGIENVEFLCGDAEKRFCEIIASAGNIDVVIVDPPRKGLEKNVVYDIVSTGAEKIGYVSCDPGTLARDIAIFVHEGYDVECIQPVDMFPQTTHVETVVCLSNKNSKPKDYVEIGVDAEDYYRIKDMRGNPDS